jgi:pimeloyl-ACP methyl ester carboxylesterase
MKNEKPKTKSHKLSWPPILPIKYPSGKTAFQVACMVPGKRIREVYPTKGEAETRATEIRTMMQNQGAGLVYITAFAPDKGKSISSLIQNPPTGAPVPPILPPQDGFLFLDNKKFHASFAADVDADKAAFMSDSQVPWGVGAFIGAISEPAWKTKPSWFLVVTEDKMIPPPAQCFMSKGAGSTVVEVAGSHAIYVSQPNAVAKLIETAATRLHGR